MDTTATIHEMMRGVSVGVERNTVSRFDNVRERLGDGMLADILMVMKSAYDGGLMTRAVAPGVRVYAMHELLPVECMTLCAGSDDDAARMLTGTALGCPFIFNHGELFSNGMPKGVIPFDIGALPSDGVMAAVNALADRGLGWLTTMLLRFIELTGRDDLNGMDARLLARGGVGYASPELMGCHVINRLHEDGADDGDPVAYAEALENGMMELYGLEEPSAVVFGAFSSPELYRRWRDATLHGAGSMPECVSSLDALYSMFMPVPSYAPSGFDERMIRALESDGRRDYEWGAAWLESIIPRSGSITVLLRRVGEGWRIDLGKSGMFDVMWPQLESQDDASKFLAVLDVIDMFDAVSTAIGWTDGVESRTWSHVALSADDVQNALALLGDGYPMDLAKEMLVTDWGGRNRQGRD